MSFEVNYNGEEKSFSSKDHAIKFMDGLDCSSDLWIANTLLRTRDIRPGGNFHITEYTYPEKKL